MELSLVIPLFNESESLVELHRRITESCSKANIVDYEILFINDGSTDNSWDTICRIGRSDAKTKGISLRTNQGKSNALDIGFRKAKGQVVITMDADLQDAPEEIPNLVRMIVLEKFDLVSGWKKKRYDSLSKTIPTKLYNWAVRVGSGIKLHDFNCGLKAYKNEVIKSISVYGELHRYIPVLAKLEGFHHIGEKIVPHAPRKYGQSKFGLNRFYNGFLDFLTILFLGKFAKRPMHFFGFIGLGLTFVSLLAALFLGIRKLYFLYSVSPEKVPLISDNPWFYISLVSMIIGVQMFGIGFLAEFVLQMKLKNRQPSEETSDSINL